MKVLQLGSSNFKTVHKQFGYTYPYLSKASTTAGDWCGFFIFTIMENNDHEHFMTNLNGFFHLIDYEFFKDKDYEFLMYHLSKYMTEYGQIPRNVSDTDAKQLNHDYPF